MQQTSLSFHKVYQKKYNRQPDQLLYLSFGIHVLILSDPTLRATLYLSFGIHGLILSDPTLHATQS